EWRRERDSHCGRLAGCDTEYLKVEKAEWETRAGRGVCRMGVPGSRDVNQLRLLSGVQPRRLERDVRPRAAVHLTRKGRNIVLIAVGDAVAVPIAVVGRAFLD